MNYSHKTKISTRNLKAVGLATVGLMSLVVWAATAAPPAAPPIPIRPLDPVEAKTVSYKKQIKPLLGLRCVSCHGASSPSAGLSVLSVKALLKGGEHGPSVIAGKPDQSPLVQYVRGIKQPRMPIGNGALSVDEIHLIREWIAAGAQDDSAGKAGKTVAVDEGVINPSAPLEDETDLTLAQIRAKHVARLPAAPRVPTVSAPTFNPIDNFVAAKWSEMKFTTPAVCDDATFVRRVYLDVVGKIPTESEASAFIADKTLDKRVRLVDTLLARDDDYAAAWLPWWEDALASNGAHQGGTGTRPNLRQWLTVNLKANRPYDEMAAELIDPTTQTPTAMMTKGWIRNDDHVETTQSAAYVAQVFLGTGVKCASCHNHFLNPEWTQRKFMGYASYFAPKDVEVIRCEVHEGDFVPPAFLFNQPAARNAAVRIPSDLDNRLKQVSRLVVDPENPRFAKCITNRLWKRYLGLGIVEPADDFRVEGNAPSHPELLKWLADDFMRHGYDLKHTIRLILTSRTYQLRYDPKVADTYSASSPDKPRYVRSPALRRMTEEQLMDSINVMMGNGTATRAAYEEDSSALTRALGRPSSRNEVSTSRSDDVAVVQALELLNGEEYSSRVSGGAFARAMSLERDPARVANHAYWSAFSRPPTNPELGAAKKFLRGESASLPEAPKPVTENIWFDSMPPAGANADPWTSAPEKMFLGKPSHSAPVAEEHREQHFEGAATPLRVERGDKLFTYVYIDPAKPPRELMLQWNDGNWEHRAYWGENLIDFGASGTAARFPMGALPPAGQWVRLEIPASSVGLSVAAPVGGMSFDQVGGRVYFNRSGVIPEAKPHAAIVDMVWALTSSPEFQYIH
jgi:mono/diheme cytochrome c family protein